MSLIELPLWMVLPFLFVLGAVIGSFLNVCIYRIPQHPGFWDSLRSLVHPPSRCPNCRKELLPRDNIPILGWFLLGGRCRFCRQSFSIRYAMIELLNGLLFVLVYWMEIPSFPYGQGLETSSLWTPLSPVASLNSYWFSPTAMLLWRYAYHMVLVEALLVATFIDFDLKIIPDGVTLPAMAVGVIGAATIGQLNLVPVWFQRGDLAHFLILLSEVFLGEASPQWAQQLNQSWWLAGSGVPDWCARYPHWHGLAVSLAGIVVGGGIVWIVRIVGQLALRQEAMGFGDVILMAMIGSFVGWQVTIMVFVIAPLLTLLLVMFRQREIPFGPYLSLATLLILLTFRWIWPVFQGIFELGPLLPFIAVAMTVALYGLLQLVQFVKWCLGIELYPSEWVEEWTSADQLAYLAMEQSNPQGQWRQEQWQQEPWPGSFSGTGRLHGEHWKSTVAGSRPTSGWTQQWQRR